MAQLQQLPGRGPTACSSDRRPRPLLHQQGPTARRQHMGRPREGSISGEAADANGKEFRDGHGVAEPATRRLSRPCELTPPMQPGSELWPTGGDGCSVAALALARPESGAPTPPGPAPAFRLPTGRPRRARRGNTGQSAGPLMVGGGGRSRRPVPYFSDQALSVRAAELHHAFARSSLTPRKIRFCAPPADYIDGIISVHNGGTRASNSAGAVPEGD